MTASALSPAIAEMREFASFTAEEQLFIERALDLALGRAGAAPAARGKGDRAMVRAQAAAYRELRGLRAMVPAEAAMDGLDLFMGPLIRITAQDLLRGGLQGFSAYRFLYERLLGAAARPWLPAAFCGAAALPQIPPDLRKQLLQSLSEAAATAPAWSEREPVFFPERIEAEAA